MTQSDITYHENQRVLLWLITGRQHGLPKKIRPVRKRRKITRRDAVFITHLKPSVMDTPKRFKRSNPANPYIQEDKIRKRDNGEKYRSHSHRIEDEASAYNKFLTMKNEQKNPPGFNQSPCHRSIQAGENPNVGPQPMRY